MFIFDLDGTIFDVSEKYYHVYVQSLASAGGDVLSKQEYWDMKRKKITDQDLLAKTQSQHCLEKYQQSWNLLIEDKNFLKYDEVWKELTSVYQQVFEHHPAILVTLRRSPQLVHWQLQDKGILSWFRFVLSRPSKELLKESWKAKVQMLKDSKVLKDKNMAECRYVGDSEADILAGKHLGMKTIAVSFGIRDNELLSALEPDVLLAHPSELANYLTQECSINTL